MHASVARAALGGVLAASWWRRASRRAARATYSRRLRGGLCEATFQSKCSSWASGYQNFAGTLGLSVCGACNGYVRRCEWLYCECERICFCFLLGGGEAPDPGGGGHLPRDKKRSALVTYSLWVPCRVTLVPGLCIHLHALDLVAAAGNIFWNTYVLLYMHYVS